MIHSLSPSAACALRPTSAENQDLSKGLLRYESDFNYTKRPLSIVNCHKNLQLLSIAQSFFVKTSFYIFMIQKQSRAGKEHEKAMMTKVQEKEKTMF